MGTSAQCSTDSTTTTGGAIQPHVETCSPSQPIWPTKPQSSNPRIDSRMAPSLYYFGLSDTVLGFTSAWIHLL